MPDRVQRSLGVGHGDGVGCLAQSRGDGGLVAGPHAQQRGDGAHQAGHLLGGGQQGARTVLAVQAELQRLLAGGQTGRARARRPAPRRAAWRAARPARRGRLGGLVLLVQALLTGVESGDLGLQRGEVVLRLRGPRLRLALVGRRAGRSRTRRRPRGSSARSPGRSAGPDPRGGRRRPGSAPRSGAPPRPRCASSCWRRSTASASSSECASTSASICASVSRTRAASSSSSSGSRPARGSSASSFSDADPVRRDPRRTLDLLAEAGQLVPGVLRRLQGRRVLAERVLEARPRARGPPAARPRSRPAAAVSAASSLSSASSADCAWTMSSASSRDRPSRTSAWIVTARRATSAWRPSGFNWRRISVIRSPSRCRLPSVASSFRIAFSLRLRCFSTPAASSTNPRRPSGVARRIESSWPWPTMTCISRPIPESLSSSWTSSSRQFWPLIW